MKAAVKTKNLIISMLNDELHGMDRANKVGGELKGRGLGVKPQENVEDMTFTLA